jgi:hypothetical protein
MAHRIEFKKTWCDECFADCYFSYDHSTGINKHEGVGTNALSKALAPLKTQGYYVKHLGRGDYEATLYKAAPLAIPLPLEWQILAESKEPEYIQDW